LVNRVWDISSAIHCSVEKEIKTHLKAKMFEQVKAGKSHRKDGREMKGLGEQRITWKVTMSKKGEKVMERMRKARQRLT
jgi:hypothetical protein